MGTGKRSKTRSSYKGEEEWTARPKDRLDYDSRFADDASPMPINHREALDPVPLDVLFGKYT